jgi:hypothetical protein
VPQTPTPLGLALAVIALLPNQWGAVPYPCCFLVYISMATSISFEWSQCHVVVRKGGWSQLAGVPAAHIASTVGRLQQLGAIHVSVVSPGVVQFQAGVVICTLLVNVFPCCPLTCPLPA